MKINYKITLSGNKSKVVEGVALSGFFAAHRVPMGWKVTHLKSGYALVDPPFESTETAKSLVGMIENAFGNDLSFTERQMPQVPGVIQDHIRFILNQIAVDQPEIVTADYLAGLGEPNG